MNREKSYTGIITIIYVVLVIVTVFAFTMLGFSETFQRLVITLVAVLVAESAVYGYTLYWLRSAGSISRTSPVLISGAFITAAYAAAVFIVAILLDWLLEVPSYWYAGVQLLILVVTAVCLAFTGIYGWNAGAQERKEGQASRSLFRQRKELEDIKLAARSWNHAETARLVDLIRSVEEKFKYSDPVSRPSLFATEDMLNQQISLLRDQVELLLASPEPGEDWEIEFKDIVASIEATLQRRNRELAALK